MVENVDNSQINPSCIFSYLGVRGLGINYDATVSEVKREVFVVDFDLANSSHSVQHCKRAPCVVLNLESHSVQFLQYVRSCRCSFACCDEQNIPFPRIMSRG